MEGPLEKMESGRDESTPFWLLGGVSLFVGLLVAAVTAIALLAYLLS
jgi:hypothetical protein